jgi:hypothetical protein
VILPRAFVDGVREISQSDYLTFWQLGEAIVRQHPRAAELADSARLAAGWAALADKVVEEGGTLNLVVGEEHRDLFVAERAHRAFALLGPALAELDHAQVKLEEEEDVSGAIVSAISFVTAMSGVADMLDTVRAPAWQKQWRGIVVDARPIDTKDLPDNLVLTGTTLELRTKDVVTQRLEVDGDASRLLRIEPFVVPRSNGPGFDVVEPTDGDREIALYDWLDQRVAELKKAAAPVSAFEMAMVCSFCGKSSKEVRKLIAGPSCFICDECVELCGEIVRNETAPSE